MPTQGPRQVPRRHAACVDVDIQPSPSSSTAWGVPRVVTAQGPSDPAIRAGHDSNIIKQEPAEDFGHTGLGVAPGVVHGMWGVVSMKHEHDFHDDWTGKEVQGGCPGVACVSPLLSPAPSPSQGKGLTAADTRVAPQDLDANARRGSPDQGPPSPPNPHANYQEHCEMRSAAATAATAAAATTTPMHTVASLKKQLQLHMAPLPNPDRHSFSARHGPLPYGYGCWAGPTGKRKGPKRKGAQCAAPHTLAHHRLYHHPAPSQVAPAFPSQHTPWHSQDASQVQVGAALACPQPQIVVIAVPAAAVPAVFEPRSARQSQPAGIAAAPGAMGSYEPATCSAAAQFQLSQRARAHGDSPWCGAYDHVFSPPSRPAPESYRPASLPMHSIPNAHRHATWAESGWQPQDRSHLSAAREPHASTYYRRQ